MKGKRKPEFVVEKYKEAVGSVVKAKREEVYQLVKMALPYDAYAIDLHAGIEQVPHPALNGRRVRKLGGEGSLYFVWRDGLACYIPYELGTYDLIFEDYEGILEIADDEFASFKMGEPLTPGACIVQGNVDKTNYLFTNGEKHPILSFSMEYCDFRRLHSEERSPQAVIDALPTGFTIAYGD